MTHFTVGIILPNDVADPVSYIANAMEPYFEHSHAAPYVCYSLEQAEQDIADTIHRFDLIVRRNDPHYNIEKCNQHLAEMRRMTPQEKYAEYLKCHDRFNASGEPISTYNQDSKWDWYVIGGRWDGWINDRKAMHESLVANTALTEEAIARNKIPHAIITPDGQWFEHGRMGWWAVLITENESWESDATELLTQYPNHNIVIVDAHI